MNKYPGGCVFASPIMNVSKYIYKVLENIRCISQIFSKSYIILYYDESNDNTLEIINNFTNTYQDVDIYVIKNTIWKNDRIKRLSRGRNIIFNTIKNTEKYNTCDYFIAFDGDDVCCDGMNLDIIKYYIFNNTEWDCLTFNRHIYYDIWALMYKPFVQHCYGFNNSYTDIIYLTQKDLKHKLSALKNTELFDTDSAFNGFAMHKLQRIINIPNLKYTYKYKEYYNEKDFEKYRKYLEKVKLVKQSKMLYHRRHKTYMCEHISFYQKLKSHGLLIRISPLILFDQ